MEDKITNIKERILQIAEYKLISKEKFLSDLGLTYGNFKGKSKNTPINSNAIADISTNHPEINLEWLIKGEGEMIKNENNYKENVISKDIATSRDTEHSADYWRGKYDQLKEDHERILQELNHIKSASAS